MQPRWVQMAEHTSTYEVFCWRRFTSPSGSGSLDRSTAWPSVTSSLVSLLMKTGLPFQTTWRISPRISPPNYLEEGLQRRILRRCLCRIWSSRSVCLLFPLRRVFHNSPRLRKGDRSRCRHGFSSTQSRARCTL